MVSGERNIQLPLMSLRGRDCKRVCQLFSDGICLPKATSSIWRNFKVARVCIDSVIFKVNILLLVMYGKNFRI